MRLSSAALSLLAASGLLALAISGCGGGSGSSVAGTGASGSGKAGANGAAGSLGGPDLNLGGEGSGSGTEDPIDTCAGELIEAKYIPLDMYIMLDKSGSMLEPTEGDPTQTKWQAVSAALSDFVSDPESAGLGVGLQVFPLRHPDAPASCTSNQECGAFGPCFLGICSAFDGILPCSNSLECALNGYGTCIPFGECELPDVDGNEYICTPVGHPTVCEAQGTCLAVTSSECLQPDDCRAVDYATPAAPIGELPAAEAGLIAVISGTQPEGLTPTGPALQGALQQATSWATAHPDHQVVAVLATDGLPTLYEEAGACAGITEQIYAQQVDAVVQLAANGRAATPAISTFAIGVMGPNDVDGPTILNAVASAGGTNQAFIVNTQGDVGAQFRDALNQIRGARLACELAVPEAEVGKTVDFQQVNITFDDGSGPATLFYVEESSGCDPTTGGWYYDKLPSAGTPERIVVCPTTCAAFGEVEMGSVQILLGCATRTPVK